MDKFHQEMLRIRERGDAVNVTTHVVMSETESKEEIVRLFNDIARSIHEGDSALQAKVVTTESAELVVAFVNSHFYSPHLKVTAKYKNGVFHITAQDDFWTQAPDQNGLWADWRDEEQLYTGEFSEEKIRTAVQNAFLGWYQRVKENGNAGLAPL
ncbi:hypothetical protein [Alicyclobacillus vulcanalis]|uniref:Uncharacterized protein n=1 Tax=Alicyclobacillus vulcanalis TaxID=252246 RepID=A0A1N7N657_9BACL|nr:hypothetical protein [Alicyclobacillus vulcanalis]SIS93631.1 hypothetical protein SAMN05421799_10789 [Alicyclobacillus vulcanalis]